MKNKKYRHIAQQWRASKAYWEDGVLVFTDGMDYPAVIIEIDLMMRELVRTSTPLWHEDFARKRIEVTNLGKQFLRLAARGTKDIVEEFRRQKLSPYFEIFAKHVELHDVAFMPPLERCYMKEIETVVAQIRAAARESSFTKTVDDAERAARKNAASLLQYVRDLHEAFARLVVVRVDVGYTESFIKDSGETGLSPPMVKGHLAQLLKHVRRKYPAVVGYIWKLEYGSKKSYHTHLMVFLDGNEVREDITIGNLIGEHWCREITHGNGTFWNCNLKKEVYAKLGTLGIGTIRYDDVEGRANMEHAAQYLAKVDYYARLDAPEVGRTFGKGVIKKRHGPRQGRPRAFMTEPSLNLPSPATAAACSPHDRSSGEASAL